jgi:hypothetical protein
MDLRWRVGRARRQNFGSARVGAAGWIYCDKLLKMVLCWLISPEIAIVALIGFRGVNRDSVWERHLWLYQWDVTMGGE